MKRISNLLRTQHSINQFIRGPKKKGGTQAKIQSNDIINIFKDRTDPEPRDIRQYPIFVQEMSLGNHTIHQQLYAVQQNVDFMMPTKPTYKAFLRGLKRQRFKTIRQFKQLDQMNIQNDEKFEIHERTSIYDFFNKTKEELEEERKAADAAAALEEDEDDDF